MLALTPRSFGSPPPPDAWLDDVGKPDFAWPTLVLAAGAVGGFVGLGIASASGTIPLALAIPLQAFLAFASFTPMHDASHKAIAPHSRWIDELVGWICGVPVLAAFSGLKYLHLEHHKHTNDLSRDPDAWSSKAKTRAGIVMRWLVLDLHYLARYLSERRTRPRGELVSCALGVAVMLGAWAIFIATGHARELVLCWLLPSRIAIVMLSVFFDWIPHSPRRVTLVEDPYRASNVYEHRWLTPLLLAQNYHLVHHLFPGVPFYRYGAVYWHIKPALVARGADLRRLFDGARRDVRRGDRLRVAEVIDETADTKTFVFDHVAPYRAGQFVVVHVPIAGGAPLRRCYSLSRPPGGRLAITVKRQGVASRWMHEHAAVGTELRVDPPAGHFVVDETSPRRRVFVAAGTGITPIAAMLEASAAPATLVYVNRDAASTVFRDRFRTAIFHDTAVSGRVDVDTLAMQLSSDVDLYACGPAGFLDVVDRAADRVNLPAAQRFSERFHPRTRSTSAPASPGPVPTSFIALRRGARTTIALAPGQTILEATCGAGLSVRASCEAGYCGTCVARVTCGRVVPHRTDDAWSMLSDGDLARGFVLPCTARPLGPEPVVIDFDAQPSGQPMATDTGSRRIYRDDVARVFDRMHVQHGVCFDFPVGIALEEHDDFTWEWFSHVDYDGIRMVDHVVRRHGNEVALPRLKIRPDRRATWREHLKPMVRKSYLRKAPASPWDRVKRDPPPSTERRLPSKLVLLSDEETRTVGRLARAQQVSVNSFVLWSLAQASRGLVAKPDDRQHWTIPVNMRGGVGVDGDAANPLSFIRVPIWPRETPQDVHLRVFDLLETGMHWVMLGWLRFFANRRRMKFPPVRSTGVFSNIGVYNVPNISRLVVCPPTGPTEPISAGLITWNGRISIALGVHHTMNPPAGELDALEQRWRAAILTGSV